ncbi:DNA internalization-related competence protein ComEC/Rec2, partial [bacterium]
GKWKLNSKGIFVTARVLDARHIEKLTDSPRGFFGLVEAFRSQVRTLIDNSGAMHKEPLKALIIAEKGGIEKTIREAYVKTGTAHILAISGLHVGMVALFSYSIIIFLFKRSERLILLLNIKKTAALLSLGPVIGYGLLAGFPVSAERAVIMAVAGIVTLLLNRGRDYLNILCLAGLAILAIEPSAVWDISFQLTFAAVGAIIYFVPKLTELANLQVKAEADKTADKPNLRQRAIKKFKRWFFLACVTTLSATLGTSPLIAYHFSRISLTGAFANLLVVPLAGVAVPLLMMSAVLMPLSNGLAGLLLFPAGWTFELMTLIARLFAALPYSSAWVSRPTAFEIALFYIFLFSVVNVRQGQYRRIWKSAAVASLFALAVSFGYWSLSPKWSKNLKVTFISVGQGESTLVEFPGGKTMLIDGGGLYGTEFDTGERLVAPFLRYKKISTIDYMVLSHAQRDHMAGLDYIAKNFNVKEFWWNGDGKLGRLESTLKENGTAIKHVDALAKKIDIGGVETEVLAPWPDSGFDQNNNCLVLRLSYKNNSFLFTGDIGEPMETALVNSGKSLKTTVLKAPHHASRYSSSWPFLNALRPSFIVASVGRDNVFGFPHADTLEKYSRLGATVLRTDQHGAIELSTDGIEVSVRQYLTETRQ